MFSVLSMTFKYFKVKIMFYNLTYYLCHHNWGKILEDISVDVDSQRLIIALQI